MSLWQPRLSHRSLRTLLLVALTALAIGAQPTAVNLDADRQDGSRDGRGHFGTCHRAPTP